ncbi:glycerophosphodiester phosphodiesterase [Acinetobacter apis]|uniref:glycerophosphodiester phosphodiesterase n=1 Tax=Acinetobacter apis TaxID=1229165 RepID=A0A217EH92_9GAMM|nr:glycerophosphodiester phosphodiesterase [Acinetobacter apis]SNQ29550.1 glycerophosphoryl diester phosphodiesterase [Acinetobacter apis]
MLKKVLLGLSAVSMFVCAGETFAHQVKKNHATQENKQDGVLVIAHRGASALRPEHTLASYQKAIEDGADIIEPDLVSTKDGVLIARHENEIGGTSNVSALPIFAQRKTTKVIDGHTLEGWFTEDFTAKEIRQLKARERIPNIRPANTTFNDLYGIPTLDQIIRLAERHYRKTGRVIGLYIETKHPTYFASQGLAMEDRLLKTLAKYKYTRDIAPVYLQSFEVTNLKYLKDRTKKYGIQHAKIIQLYDDPAIRPADFVKQDVATTYADLATANGLKQVATYADGVGPSKGYIFNQATQQPTTYVADAHQAGLKVHPYTFRPENNFLPENLKCSAVADQRCPTGSIKEIQQYIKLGIDGFFTDDSKLGREAIATIK